MQMNWGKYLQRLSKNKWFLMVTFFGTIITIVSFFVPPPQFVYDSQIQGFIAGACSALIVFYMIGLSQNNWYPYRKWYLAIYRRILLSRAKVPIRYTRIITNQDLKHTTVYCKIGEQNRFIFPNGNEKESVTLVFSVPIGYELELTPREDYIDSPEMLRKEKKSKKEILYVYRFESMKKYSQKWSISIHKNPW